MRKIERDDENPIDNIIIDSCDIIKPYFYKLGFTPNGITTLSLIFGLLSKYPFFNFNCNSIISFFFSVILSIIDKGIIKINLSLLFKKFKLIEIL
jgi:hypothetical protein